MENHLCLEQMFSGSAHMSLGPFTTEHTSPHSQHFICKENSSHFLRGSKPEVPEILCPLGTAPCGSINALAP